MLSLLAAVVLAAAPAPAPAPSACPSDLLVANPQLKVVRAIDRSRDNYVVTVDVTNRGIAAQPPQTRQHLDLLRGGEKLGAQPIPALGARQSYVAAFRVQLPHERSRRPFPVELHYVLDSKNAPRANCTSVNDRLAATL